MSKKDNSQAINFLFILVGGGILTFVIAVEGKDHVYLLILGLILLMYGLYKATNHWSYTKDDHLEEQEDSKEDKNSKDV
ncbi:MAG TPA: hypothetical protein VFM60_06955 [Salinimicrobium sp.]|nr:hypothetical protein [Salinimicrobium sp.]